MIMDSDGCWKRYEVLPQFAIALSVIVNSNSEVKRAFLMNNIHQNKQRNCLSQESLNSHLHIKSGVECKSVRRNCTDCKVVSSADHCHCSYIDVTNKIRDSCKNAHRKYKNATDNAKVDKQAIAANCEEKLNKFNQRVEDEISKMKEVFFSMQY